MEFLIISMIIWLAAPIPLLILWLAAHSEKKKLRRFMQQLYAQHRIHPEELRKAGLRLPSVPEAQPLMQQPVLHAAPDVLQPPAVPGLQTAPADPARSLDDAAARAAKIAEAEISGTNLTPEAIAWEIAAERQNVAEAAADTDIAKPEAVTEQVQPAAEASENTDAAEPENVTEQVQPAAEAAENTDIAEPETVTEPTPPETVFAGAPARSVPAAVTPPDGTAPSPVYGESLPNRISAITIMLSVGVLLVIIAGLIFVRSAWGSLTDGGRLATLAAGSVLFFGTSALAQRVWKLDRTGMAFFTLGAAFLPISVWAAGYLKLLGEGLSGAGNPWLIALSFAAFTVISLIAVRIYKQKSWGIAFLCGLTVTYLCIAAALTVYRETTAAPFLIAAAVYALLLAFGARPLSERLPQQIGSVLEPFAFSVSILNALTVFGFVIAACGFMLDQQNTCRWLYAVPAFIAAFAFFSPMLTEWLKNGTVIPVTLLAVPGFTALLIPLCKTVFSYTKGEFTITAGCSYIALMLMLCALLWLILLMTNSLPDETGTGFLFGAAGLDLLAILMQLPDLTRRPLRIMLTMLAAGAVLLIVWLLILRKKTYERYTVQHALIGAKIWSLCTIGAFAADKIFRGGEGNTVHIGIMLSALCFLPGFALLLLMKKHRTGVSDLLLTVSPALPLLHLVSLEPRAERLPWQWCGMALLAGLTLLYFVLAFAHDTRKPHQYAFAVLTLLLPAAAAAASAADGLLKDYSDTRMLICWSLISFAIGAAAYLTTKRQFHGVRKLMFWLAVVPPVTASAFVGMDLPDLTQALWQLICAAAMFGVWKIFANRGFRLLAAGAFGTGLLLLAEATGVAVYNYIYDGRMNFTVLMIASLWILLCSLLAIAVSRRMLFFVGGNSVTWVMQILAPASALLLSGLLVFMEQNAWESFFFVYVFALCVLAWFTTEKQQAILPGICAFSLVLCIESLRSHTFGNSDGSVALTLLLFCGMTILFPYLGLVSREEDAEPSMQRRSFVLTAMGALIPSWLLAAAFCGTHLGNYSHEQKKWFYFFVPVLVSGYLLHFLLFEKNEKTRKLLMTAAAALGTVAFWMQPLVDVSDTWLEGKLHLVPLFAFGIVIRYLYGREIGGKFLFGIGLYTMLRLAATAVITEEGTDVLTLLVTAFAMFLASFLIRQKKWFALGGISLALTAVYIHMKLTEGRQWWLYLLLAGLILIVVAGSNEMLKQRGESLRSRAGRLWDDWEW